MKDQSSQNHYLTEVASKYFSLGMSEQEIADDLGMSVQEVREWVDEARREGLTADQAHSFWERDHNLEQELKATFNLQDTRVLVRENRTYSEMITGLGYLAARYFSEILTPSVTVGISWGSALYQMIQALPPRQLPNVEVVQLIGATGNENIPTDGPMLAQLLSHRLGANCWYLHTPLVVDSEAAKQALLRDHNINETLRRAERAEIALVGIGTTKPELYSLLRAGYVSEKELAEIRAAGAVGDICAQHYNADGEWLDIDINHKVMGITLHTLSKIKTVIGVAGGQEKVKTIFAALKGQYVNVLITDDVAARQLLDLAAGILPPLPAVEVKPQHPLVSLKGIWKVFGGIPVLKGVDFDLMPGEIHALLGGNGSGKSTLMKVLSGIYSLDAGSIEFTGSPIEIDSPGRAHELGIYYVPQEPKIFEHLSVEENILLGLNVSSPAEERQRINDLAKELGFEANLTAAAGTLSIANQQLLEIIRGLVRNARVLILDEPTSTLTFREVEALFERMRTLTARGIGIIFISHRLNEIEEIADRISVLRDGVFVLTDKSRNLNSRDLIRAMLPEDVAQNEMMRREEMRMSPAVKTEPVLEVQNLSGDAFYNISLQVYPGEVVGLAGLVGAGRTELAQAIVGIDSAVRGVVRIGSQEVTHRSPAITQEKGLVYVPEDRHAYGIFEELPFVYTITAGIMKTLGKVLMSATKERQIARSFVDRLQIKISDLDQLGRTLSGGNQQKVVLAKALAIRPKVIIFDEPTRGVDAQARQDVYHLIQELKTQNVGMLLISSDLEEVILLSDRVLVMYHGTIVEELEHSECQLERITAASFGVTGEA